jgi:hypothetical protein
MNREKIRDDAVLIQTALRRKMYTAEETVALLKTLQHLLCCQCIEKDLVVVSLKKIKELGGDEDRARALMKESTTS